MGKIAAFVLVAAALGFALGGASSGEVKTPKVLSFKMKGIDGREVDLAKFQGKVVLIVNVASECGLTPQYKGLQALHEKYKAKGLVVLGFPSNDFGQQEPGSATEIADFCDRTYAVKFPMFAKTSVKDPGGSAVFDALAQATGQRPQWNFHKYLIARDGATAVSFPSKVDPESKEFLSKVEELLSAR